MGLIGSALLASTGCATIVNDANIPIVFSFSDGSNGFCSFTNKRGMWQGQIPGSVMIRRSDDNLNYRCKLDDGREAEGFVASEIEGEKLGASVLFFDLGITDAITDKHRNYQRNFVIPVRKES
jgi:hypothetical protein